MAKSKNDNGAIYVPAVGEKVTYLTPQRKEIPDCEVVKIFDNNGRIRVKSADGNVYSGTLDQVKPQ